jgi:hypothetical protein
MATFFPLAGFFAAGRVEAGSLATLTDFLVFAGAAAATVTFSGALAGAFVVLSTSLAGTATGADGTETGAGAAAFVLPFGRPPFRAN